MWLAGAMDEGLDLKDTSNPYSRATLAAVSLYLLSGPARIIFDFTYVQMGHTCSERGRGRFSINHLWSLPSCAPYRLGCSVLTRIYELRHVSGHWLGLDCVCTCRPLPKISIIHTLAHTRTQAILTDETNEAREQNEALILLSRRILLYIALSTLMNVIIYIPQTPSVGSGWTVGAPLSSFFCPAD